MAIAMLDDGPIPSKPQGAGSRTVDAAVALRWLGRHRSHLRRVDAPSLLAWLGALTAGGRRVRLHTSEVAHARLCQALGTTSDGLSSLLAPPPRVSADVVARAMTRSRHLGCIHLRQWTVGAAPESGQLLRDFFTAFVRGRWIGWSGLDYVVDDGCGADRCAADDAAAHGRLLSAAAACGLLPTMDAADI